MKDQRDPAEPVGDSVELVGFTSEGREQALQAGTLIDLTREAQALGGFTVPVAVTHLLVDRIVCGQFPDLSSPDCRDFDPLRLVEVFEGFRIGLDRCPTAGRLIVFGWPLSDGVVCGPARLKAVPVADATGNWTLTFMMDEELWPPVRLPPRE